MRFLPDRAELRVAVVGFGYVGSCYGIALADRGLDVLGIDSDPSLIGEMAVGRCRFHEPGLAEACTRVVRSGRLQLASDFDRIAEMNVIIITVGTPIESTGRFLSDQLEDACRALGGVLRPGQLVIVKSTIPPGTTRRVVLPLLERGGLVAGRDFGLVHCPERLAEGAALGQLASLPVVVGGCDPASTRAASAFWHRTLRLTTLPVAGPETAELVKLATNWWIDTNIALANELAIACDVFDVDALDVIDAANTLPKGGGRVNFLLPSVGVGGSCLPKDPWLLWWAAQQKGVSLRLVETARAVNDAMPAYTVDLIRTELARLGKSVETARIAILGLAFKNDTGDLRLTPVKPVIDGLHRAGATIRAFDPLVPPAEAKSRLGITPAATLGEGVAGADCVAVLAAHQAFEGIDFADLAGLVSMPCLLLDGRAYYPRHTVASLRGLGFAYCGIGR